MAFLKRPSLHARCLPGVVLLVALASIADQPDYRHGISIGGGCGTINPDKADATLPPVHAGDTR